MIDHNTFESELSAIRKDLTKVTIGSFSGYSHVNSTPAHTFHCMELLVPELGFLHIVSRDSFRQDTVGQLAAVFERIRIKRYKKDMLYVYRAYELDHFDSVGLAPPQLAKVYDSQSAILAKYGYQLFPMYGLEFLHGFTEGQFWAQRRRQDEWRVCILDWNRTIETKGTPPNN